jgi:hypothetical protein
MTRRFLLTAFAASLWTGAGNLHLRVGVQALEKKGACNADQRVCLS